MFLVRNYWERVKWLGRSSTLRLSVLLSIIFALGFASAIFVALSLGETALERRVDETLEAMAAATISQEVGADSPSMILRPLDDLRGLPGPFVRAVTRDGGTIALRDDYQRADIWRVLVTEDSEGTDIVVAVPFEESAGAQELLGGVLWSTAAFIIAITLLVGLVAGLWAQRRLLRITKTLDRLAQGDLSARTGHTGSSDDLDDMARQLDHTAAELDRLVAQTRHLSASIAHDLRTPLARLQAQLEMLPHGEGRSAALEEASRLSSIFDTIMRVARIEAAQGKEGFERVALADLAKDLVETFGPVVEDAGKALTLTVQTDASVLADRNMVIQALANLIQNALVHGGDKISVFAKGHILGVADNGRGVPPDQFSQVVKPMVRLDAARTTDGSGLGLALVRAVADRHGARLEMGSQTPHGLRVGLNFANL